MSDSAPTILKFQIGQAMRQAGVEKAVVEFSGYGDSGSTEDPVFENATEMQIPDHDPRLAQHFMFYGGEIAPVESLTLPDIIKRVADMVLQGSGLDWYNNEGGQGQIEFLFEQGEQDPEPVLVVRAEIGINVTHTEDHSFDWGND